RAAFLAGLTFALIACAGNFQLMTSALYGGLAFLAYRMFHWSSVEKTLPWRDRWSPRRLLPVLLLGLWGAAPVALQLVPTYQFSQLSTRNQPDYDQLSGTFSMRPSSTYEFLFPDMGLPPGKSAEASIQDIDPPNTDNMSLGDFGYLGVWMPFLAFLAFKRKDRRFLYFLGGMSLLSLLTAWGRYFPLHRILCAVLPGIALSRAPFRFLDVYVLFMVILSAYGFQALERRFSGGTEEGKPWALGGGAYALLLLAVALFQADRNWREMLGLALGAAGLFGWGFFPGWQRLGRLLFQAALALPLLLSGWGDFGTGPASNYDFDRNAPIFTELQKAPEGSRFFMDMQVPYPVLEDGRDLYFPMPQDEAMNYRVRLVNGYDSINIRRTRDLQNANLGLPVYAALWDVRGLIFGQDRGESDQFNHQVIGTAHYYGLKTPVSHLLAPSRLQVLPDDQCLAAMRAPGFHPQDQAYLAAPLPADEAAELTGKPAKLSYEWLRDDND
ncbi:MAG TPA: hypothetical protein VFR02_04990, partial [bacterium]|nr:hypothetical protein [bacterium]